jgi:phage terminase small subunit
MADDATIPPTADVTPSALSPDQEDVRAGKFRNWADAYERCKYSRSGKPPRDQLNEFQEMFVNEYQIDFDATNAYIRAGGKGKHPSARAADLKKVPKVAAAIEELRVQRLARLKTQQEQIILELANLTHTDLDKDFKVTQRGRVKSRKGGNPLATRALKKIRHKVSTTTIGDETTVEHTVDYEIHDKNTSARTLLQHLGALPEHVRVGDPNGNPLPVAVLVIREVDETTTGEKR